MGVVSSVELFWSNMANPAIQEAAQYGMPCRGSREGRRRGGEKEGRAREQGTGRRKSLGLLVVRQQELG
jgi:hypothetical protein